MSEKNRWKNKFLKKFPRVLPSLFVRYLYIRSKKPTCYGPQNLWGIQTIGKTHYNSRNWNGLANVDKWLTDRPYILMKKKKQKGHIIFIDVQKINFRIIIQDQGNVASYFRSSWGQLPPYINTSRKRVYLSSSVKNRGEKKKKKKFDSSSTTQTYLRYRPTIRSRYVNRGEETLEAKQKQQGQSTSLISLICIGRR